MVITRGVLPASQLLPLLVVALVHLVATPGVTTAAPSTGGGAGVQVAIPGVVALLAYLTAGLLLLGLVVARRRPMA